MKQVLAILAGVAMVAACGLREDRISFDGQYFRAKAKRIDKMYEQFTVTVKPVSASLAGARAAGEYEAIEYCVNNFGSSEIEWLVGPQTPASALTIDGDTLIFQGTCPNR